MRTTRLIAAVLLALFLTVPSPARAAESLPQLVERATPGVVTILAYNPDMVMPGVGTGFFVAPDRVVTARHVLARVDRAVVRTHDGKTVAIVGILAEERASDLVLVQLKEAVAGAAPLTVAADAPAVGERLFTVSSPLGLEFTAADGIVSAYREVPGAGVSMQHTVAVSVGSSGCPLLNDRGRVVAVQTGVITAGQRIVHAGQALNFAVSGRLVSSMREVELRGLAECRDDIPAGWKPPITKGIDSISLHALTRDDFRASLDFFLQAAAQEPEEADVWFRVALCYEKLGDKEKAVEHYRKAIALKPGLAVALNNLGSVLIDRGEYVEATKALNDAIAARPDYSAAYGNLAVACVGAKNWEGARDAARQAVRLNANDAEARLNWGTAALRLGDRDEAGRQQTALQKIDPARAERLRKLLAEESPTPAPAEAPATK